MAWVLQSTDFPGSSRGPGWTMHDDDNPGTFYWGNGRSLSTLKDEVWRFQTTGDVWTAMAPTANTVGFFCGVAKVGRYIYVLGGESSGSGGWRRNFRRYSMDTNVWTELADHPLTTGIGHVGLAEYGGFVYAFGGTTFLSGSNTETNLIYRYEIATGVWTPVGVEMPAMHSASGIQALTFNDRIIVGPVPDEGIYNGGLTPHPKWLTKWLVFNPSTQTYTYYGGDLPYGISRPRITKHGAAIYLSYGSVHGDLEPSGVSRKVFTTQPDSATAWVDTGIPYLWDNLLGGDSPGVNYESLPGGAGLLYAVPAFNSVSNSVYEHSVAIPIAPGADLSVIRDVREFRYPYRWPELIERYGGTKWDQVAEKFTYDEETGTFSG